MRLLALSLLSLVPLVTAAAPTGGGTSLTVAAAASLKPAVEEWRRDFEAAHPRVSVSVVFGASGTFFAQIQAGAPFDLFLSADREYPDRIVAAGLGAAADEKVFAIGRLVVWTPSGSPLDIGRDGLASVAGPGVRRIAIANPAVAPFGRAAEGALRSAGILDAVRERLVLGTSVGQAAQFATTGAADVAFLPWSLALEKELAGGRVFVLPENAHPRIELAGVVLSAAREAPLARAFLAHAAGPGGRAALTGHGFGLP